MATGNEKNTKASKRSSKKEEEEHEPQVETKLKSTKKETVKKEQSKKDVPKKAASKKEEKSVSKESKTEKKSSKSKVEEKVEQKVEEKGEVQMKFLEQFALLQEEFKRLKECLQNAGSTLKKLESTYTHDIKKTKKHKQKRNGPHKPTGFAKPQVVPDKLAKFIGVKSGTQLTGPDVTSRVWKQLKEKNLTFEDDNRVFRTNKEVSEIFSVPQSVNKSTNHKDKNGFNFCNLQKYIKNAYVKQ